MSDEQKDELIHVFGDWWVLAAYFQDAIRHETGGYPTLNVTPGRCLLSSGIGAAIITPGDENMTTITIHRYGHKNETRVEWDHIVSQAKRFSDNMRTIKRGGQPTAEDVIERYYRARAQKCRITLRQLAEEYGFNESYLRQAKVQYDRAGKWGSKKSHG